MKSSLRIAPLIVMAAIGGACLAQETMAPCKNHFILDEPCVPEWTAVNNGLPDLDVQVVAVDPVDRNTVYAGGSGGLFRSVDGGASWSGTGLVLTPLTAAVSTGRGSRRLLTAASRIAHVAIHPADPKTIYASTVWSGACFFWQRRLFRSTDGGASWDDGASPAINGCDNIHSLELAPSDPSTVYLTNFDDFMGDTWSPLVRSSNAAASWDYLGYPVLNVLAVDASDAYTLYAGSFDFQPYFTSLPNGVLKSVDGGATWVPTGLTGMGISALALDRGNPGTIYAAAAGAAVSAEGALFRGLFKSTDGGVTWSGIGTGLEQFLGEPSTVVAVVVDPGDSNVVYVAMPLGGIWRSGDAGASWQPFSEGLGSAAIRSLAIAAGRPATLYAGTSSGVFTITEPGRR